jgi:hypothetical protein
VIEREKEVGRPGADRRVMMSAPNSGPARSVAIEAPTTRAAVRAILVTTAMTGRPAGIGAMRPERSTRA